MNTTTTIPRGVTGYASMIAILSPRPVTPDECRWIEAWMRLERGTLNSLSESQAKYEIEMALLCIKEAGPADSESLAQSFGL